MNQKQQELHSAPVGRLLLQYAVPAMIGMMVNALYNVVDRMFIGNIDGVGELAMAGLGVTLPMVSAINAFGMLLAVGGATAISLKQGAGEGKMVERLLGNVITLTVIIGLSITIIGIGFSQQILLLFGGSAESIPYAQAYIDIILLGCVFSLFGSVFSYLIRGDGNPKLSATIMGIGCLLNIVLDALLIYGFNFGIQGAAIATVFSQFVTTSMGFYYYLQGKSHVKLHRHMLNLSRTHCKTILIIGFAPFAMQIAGSCVQVMSNNLLATYGGDLAIGAMATIMSIMMMVGMPIVGLSTGMQPIVSYNYGAQQYHRAEETLKLGFGAATVILLAGWALLTMFPAQVVGMFNSDPSLLAVTMDGMGKYMLVFPLLGVSYIGTNFIQSTGQATLALVLSLLRQVLFLAPLFMILPRFWGLDGVWYAQPIADVLSALVTTAVVLHTIHSYRKKGGISHE